MTNDQLIKYYKDLLIRQYHEKPKARGLVEAFVAQGVADQIIKQVIDAFDIDTAVGAQLDIIGKYVGIPRRVNGFDPDRTYMAIPRYDDANKDTYQGLYEYGDTTVNFFHRYVDAGSAYAMNDEEMRTIIKLRVMQLKSDHTLYDIDIITDEIFGSGCAVTDGQNMTITYDFTGMVDPGNVPAIAAYMEVLPKPAGVDIIISGL
jgi:hypothetical protein